MTAPARQCGGCTACCKITPVAEINKPANTRCKHQRFGKGCAIYARRPMSCRLWSCAWLTGDGPADLRRPDHAHYVIDTMLDFITLKYDDATPDQKIPVIQVWLDPHYPDAHRDKVLRDYIERLGKNGTMALIRNGSMDAFVLCPPTLSHDGQWHEKRSAMRSEQHSQQEIFDALEEATIRDE